MGETPGWRRAEEGGGGLSEERISGGDDCTHFKWAGGPFSEARLNTGKEGYPSVAVEAACDHTGVVSLRLAIVLLACRGI